jgi:hypothetical protein
MNYAVEMVSGAIIYMPSVIKIGSGIQRLVDRDALQGDIISLF